MNRSTCACSSKDSKREHAIRNARGLTHKGTSRPRRENMTTIQAKTSEQAFKHELQLQFEGSPGKSTPTAARIKYLRIALRLVGVTFVFGVHTLTLLWPSGWSWHTGHHIPHYLQMILGIYATLGIFLLLASRNPLAHLSLIWFTVWSSVVHAGVMAVQSLANSEHMGHLWGDVLALFIVAAVLAALTPRGAVARAA